MAGVLLDHVTRLCSDEWLLPCACVGVHVMMSKCDGALWCWHRGFALAGGAPGLVKVADIMPVKLVECSAGCHSLFFLSFNFCTRRMFLDA
jgi:hypothetical protein